MKRALVTIAVLISSTMTKHHDHSIKNHFLDPSHTTFIKYMAEYGKTYITRAEYLRRKEIFDMHLREINEHNALPDKTWTMAINKFTDADESDFQPVSFHNDPNVQSLHEIDNDPTIASWFSPVDWRDYMNPPRDQGIWTCGSCWAFTAIAVLEGRYAMKYGKKVQLSEQQLVDCDSQSAGCKWGYARTALDHIYAVGGSESARTYPYTGVKGVCSYNKANFLAKIKDVKYVMVPKSAVSSGPIGGVVKSHGFPFQMLSYREGIFDGVCSGEGTHAMAIVGWGKDQATGFEYWIMRNSQGPNWGDQGHIKIRINGNCYVYPSAFLEVA